MKPQSGVSAVSNKQAHYRLRKLPISADLTDRLPALRQFQAIIRYHLIKLSHGTIIGRSPTRSIVKSSTSNPIARVHPLRGLLPGNPFALLFNQVYKQFWTHADFSVSRRAGAL